jgi:hypothetical protein
VQHAARVLVGHVEPLHHVGVRQLVGLVEQQQGDGLFVIVFLLFGVLCWCWV